MLGSGLAQFIHRVLAKDEVGPSTLPDGFEEPKPLSTPSDSGWPTYQSQGASFDPHLPPCLTCGDKGCRRYLRT